MTDRLEEMAREWQEKHGRPLHSSWESELLELLRQVRWWESLNHGTEQLVGTGNAVEGSERKAQVCSGPSPTEPDGYCLKRPDGSLLVEECFSKESEARAACDYHSIPEYQHTIVPVRVVEVKP